METFVMYSNMPDITDTGSRYPNICISFLSDFSESKNVIVNICNKFKYIFEILSQWDERANSLNVSKYCYYINYYLNDELYKLGGDIKMKADSFYMKLMDDHTFENNKNYMEKFITLMNMTSRRWKNLIVCISYMKK